MSSSLSYEFLFEDCSSSHDSNIDELLNNDETEHMILILTTKGSSKIEPTSRGGTNL
jgi:hypothetical protein